jgi:hypothetical protein
MATPTQLASAAGIDYRATEPALSARQLQEAPAKSLEYPMQRPTSTNSPACQMLQFSGMAIVHGRQATRVMASSLTGISQKSEHY